MHGTKIHHIVAGVLNAHYQDNKREKCMPRTVLCMTAVTVICVWIATIEIIDIVIYSL